MLDSLALPAYHSADAELKKAGVLRFILGVIIFVRFFQIFSSYSVYNSEHLVPQAQYWEMAVHLFFIFSFAIGFLTQVSTVLVMIGAVDIDNQLATRTLGTDVLTGVMFVLFMLNAGQRYSIDRLILTKGGRLARALGPIQWFSGSTEMRHIKAAYVSGFLFYALLSFVALSYHIVDPFWLSGLTTKSLFTNSYLCKYYWLFRDFEELSPVALSLFSIFSAIGQSVFQLLMVPLMFCRWGKRFVCFWGFSFFLISLVFINLSYLPHIELVLWSLIFIPGGSASRLGARIYMKIAPYNRELVETCDLSPRPPCSELLLRYPLVGGLVRGLCLGSFGFCCVLFLFLEAPGIRTITQRALPESVIAAAQKGLGDLGFETPHVFNQVDLSMGDRWLEISVQSPTGEWALVPLRGSDGERLNYEGFDLLNFSNHNSDWLYFGETLRLARSVINGVQNPAAFFNEGGAGFESIAKRIRYDYFKRRRSGTTIYLVRFKANRSSYVSHWRADPERFQTEVLYDALYQYDGQGRPTLLPASNATSDARVSSPASLTTTSDESHNPVAHGVHASDM